MLSRRLWVWAATRSALAAPFAACSRRFGPWKTKAMDGRRTSPWSRTSLRGCDLRRGGRRRLRKASPTLWALCPIVGVDVDVVCSQVTGPGRGVRVAQTQVDLDHNLWFSQALVGLSFVEGHDYSLLEDA